MSVLRFIPAGMTGALFLFVGGLLPLAPASAQADTVSSESRISFDIPSQDLDTALSEFARQSGQELIYAPEAAQDRSGNAVIGEMTRGAAMEQLLDGTGLEFLVTPDGGMMIGEPATVEAYRSRLRRRSGQPGATLAGQETIGQRRPGIEEIIVTGQKREERIQDVPIAISAFSQEDLTVSQIAGGPDLMTQIPNFTFTKTNFTSYSIQIRGIGTQAISATVDPAVAVAFNNTPFIANRFFEQEFYDMERVEVLRGPQGTLFGRNATAGVVNLISAKPVHGQFESMFSVDVANFGSRRLEGMVNIPIEDDVISLRLAGAMTKRDGFVTNKLTDEQTDGRDLWSTRASLRITPSDSLDINFIWEHFEEDDERLRSGKQLCTRHEFPEQLRSLVENSDVQGGAFSPVGRLTQGCQMGSLYDDEAFQVPNGFALPFYGPLANLSLPIFEKKDPYTGTAQSHDLREIETRLEPIYEAKSDILHIAVEYDLTDGLTLNSETAYGEDELFSHNDFNRFNTAPNVFNPDQEFGGDFVAKGILDEDGTFCDPQLGCSNRLLLGDLATSDSKQFSQEFRITSNFDGPFNFHLGTNYLAYDTTIDYFVFANSLSLFGALWCGGDDRVTPENPWDPHDTEAKCIRTLEVVNPDDVVTSDDFSGIYIDRNPLRSLDSFGRNYFLSRNPFDLESYSVFGEGVYNLTDTLKVTAGLRYTVDRKEAPVIPTWLLVSQTYGLPTKEIFTQTWREPTGRLVVDWQPLLGFTDETLLYASYARGYKAGGSNPPLPGALPLGLSTESAKFIQATQPKDFDAEFVDAFEIGTKNTLFDGGLVFNLGAFYYDYQGYQISQIVNRSAVNLNFDAEIWGLELETDWRPLENLVLSLKGGYEDTKVGEGQSAIDMIDRTAGDPDFAVIKPFPAIPSNCIVPVDMLLEPTDDPGRGWLTDFAGTPFDCRMFLTPDIDPITGAPFEPNPTHFADGDPLAGTFWEDYPGFHPATVPNGGAGIAKDLGGNELPNAPDTTLTLSVDYTIPLSMDWVLTLHGDYYRQSEAWTRIYNEDPYDKLEPFSQINLAAILSSENGWNIMAYVKNAEDKDNITGAFLNSDDAGLTTNVFLNEPRLFGLRVTKRW